MAASARKGKPVRGGVQCSRDTFNQWKVDNGRVYSGAEEEASRYAIFCDNMKKMHEHQLDNPTAAFHMNKFADVDEAEFKRTHRNFAFDAAGQARSCLYSGNNLNAMTKSFLPTSFDWRSQGKVSPVKDQGQCGGCWAFATIANMESFYAISHGVKATTQFSEQMLIDCSHGCSTDDGERSCNQGCNGGFPWNSFADILSWGGVVSESSYPYRAHTQTCKINFNNKPALQSPISNYTCLTSPRSIGNEDTMAAWLVANGPFTIGINAGPLQSYSGGILDPSHCSASGIDHAVTIVGFGQSNGKNYWIIKNSWGSDWGLSGFFYLIRGKGACGVNYAASSVTYH
jgi:cathepsin F